MMTEKRNQADGNRMTADDFLLMAQCSLAQGEDPEHTGSFLARQLRDNGYSLEEALIIGRCGYVPLCRWVDVTDETSPYTKTQWEEAAGAVYSETPPAELPGRRADSSPLLESPPHGPTPATTLDPDSGSDSVPSALPGMPEPTAPTESTTMSENVPTRGAMPQARLRNLNIDRQAEIKNELERHEPEARAPISGRQFSSPTPDEMLLAMGWSIIPLDLHKKPLIKWKAFKNRQATPEELREWMSDRRVSVYGMVTGPLSGTFSLDFDRADGIETMRKLGLRPHRMTPSNGFHVDFTYPDGWDVKTLNDQSKKELHERLPGMDSRGLGGYAAVCGQAVIKGSSPPRLGEYVWLRDPSKPPEPYAIFPQELLDFLRRAAAQQKEPGPKPAPNVEKKSNGQDTSERVAAELLISKAVRMLGSMGRNDAGACLAIQGRDNGYSKAEVLGFKWHSYCPATDRHGTVSPYTAGEWQATVESIFSRPAREPWGLKQEKTNQNRHVKEGAGVNGMDEEPPPGAVDYPEDATDCPSPSPLRAAEELREEPEKPDPAGEGAAILEDLLKLICRFVDISDAQATVLALWTVHTHCFAACDATAYIWLFSAEKRSGKTRVEEVEELVVAKPWYTGRVTPACLVRKIDAQQPTLLLDESDTALASSEEYREALTGVLNMGHRRGGKTSCCVGRGADITYKDFDAFSPKMIAGLRSIPDTVRDRAIPIRIQRKKKRHENRTLPAQPGRARS